jgi:hypothetical protein
MKDSPEFVRKVFRANWLLVGNDVGQARKPRKVNKKNTTFDPLRTTVAYMGSAETINLAEEPIYEFGENNW